MNSAEHVLKIVLSEDNRVKPSEFQVIVLSRYQSFVNFNIDNAMYSVTYIMDSEDCFGDVLQIQVLESDGSVVYILNYFVDDKELVQSDNSVCAEPTVSYIERKQCEIDYVDVPTNYFSLFPEA